MLMRADAIDGENHQGENEQKAEHDPDTLKTWD